MKKNLWWKKGGREGEDGGREGETCERIMCDGPWVKDNVWYATSSPHAYLIPTGCYQQFQQAFYFILRKLPDFIYFLSPLQYTSFSLMCFLAPFMKSERSSLLSFDPLPSYISPIPSPPLSSLSPVLPVHYCAVSSSEKTLPCIGCVSDV